MTQPSTGVGLAGWGLSGTVFMAPFIKATDGLDLHAVLTSREVDPTHYPGVTAVRAFDDLLTHPAINLIVIATPNHVHAEQGIKALEAGKHVVIEKPLGQTSDEVRTVITAAEKADRLVIPFQNRRWDGDFLTVKKLVEDGRLGEVHYALMSWPRYKPQAAERAAWKQNASHYGGVLYDLGPHLIDQALTLFGPPESVCARVWSRHPERDGVIDGFQVDLRYGPRLQVRLDVDMFNAGPPVRFHLRGSRATYENLGVDPQEAQVKAGLRPGAPGYGIAPAGSEGILTGFEAERGGFSEKVATLPGDYRPYWSGVRDAIRGEAPPPVLIPDSLLQLRIIEAALESSKQGAVPVRLDL